jgi:hypothetical protein
MTVVLIVTTIVLIVMTIVLMVTIIVLMVTSYGDFLAIIVAIFLTSED